MSKNSIVREQYKDIYWDYEDVSQKSIMSQDCFPLETRIKNEEKMGSILILFDLFYPDLC